MYLPPVNRKELGDGCESPHDLGSNLPYHKVLPQVWMFVFSLLLLFSAGASVATSKETYTWNGSAFSATPASTTLYYWDAWNLVYEAKYTHSGPNKTFAEAKSFYWGLDWSGSIQGASGVGGLIGLRHHTGGSWSQVYYPSFDGNGNLMALYQSDGTPRAEYEYGAYGKLLRASGDLADLNPFRFATKYFDLETGLYQYQHRYYSPHMGRFLSRDPAGDGLNLYALVNNGPVNNFDVFGLYGYMPEMPALPSLQQIMFLGPEASSQLADRQWATWERSVASTTSYYNDIARISAIGSIRAMDAVSAIRTEFISGWAIANVKAQADAQAYMNSQRSYWQYGIGVGGKSSGQSAASQWTHGMLEGLGMAPGIGIPFDIANGLVYAYEGDAFNATLSFGAAVPVLGYGANAFRGARYADEFIDFGRHYGDDVFGGGARYLDDVNRYSKAHAGDTRVVFSSQSSLDRALLDPSLYGTRLTVIPSYNSQLADRGLTIGRGLDAQVEIGPAAFTDRKTLLDTIIHEEVHVRLDLRTARGSHRADLIQSSRISEENYVEGVAERFIKRFGARGE